MATHYVLIILAALAVAAIRCDMQNTLNASIDGHLDFKELSTKNGHPPNVYQVTTEDGYILEVNNFPGNKTKPVLFLHGVFDTSDGWIMRGNTSLGILVADEGYDAWFINFRGNRYSRKHTSLDPDKNDAFWDFSAHEYGTYDLPACIDFILNSTGQKQLSIVGFSEGTTSVFVLASTQPEYNKKVKIFVAIAPVVFLEHVRPFLSTIIYLSPIIDFFLPRGMQEIAGYYSITKALINLLCTNLVIGYEICYQGGMNSVSGFNSSGIERDFFRVIIGHFPGGTSRKNLMHFSQMSLSKSFSQYDHGTAKNLLVYRSFSPPSYDLKKVTIKTVLVSGKDDTVSTLEDVNNLKKALPNLVEHKIVEGQCNHLDHMWGEYAKDLEYTYILDMLKRNYK